MNNRLLKATVAAVLLALVGVVAPAAACIGPPPMPPSVWIIFANRTTVWIVFHKYITFPVSTGQFCACGLTQTASMTGITSAQVVDSSTNKVIDSFAFAPNDAVAKNFADFAPPIGTVKVTRSGDVVPSASALPWGGFLAPIQSPVAGGISVDLWICVTVRPGTTFGQLAAELSSQGQVGTSAANADGSFVPGHTNTVRPGMIMNMGTVPADHLPQ